MRPTRHLLLGVLLIALLAVGGPVESKVVNENVDELPPGCDSISEEIEFTVEGGTRFAQDMPGVVFTFDERSFDLPACARVTVTFVNHDEVRHQWMPHGVYPDGTFLIEVDGPGEETGTFITGPRAESVMVHCGVSQHQQKGMKGQLLVAGGLGDIPNIPGVAGLPPEDRQAQGDVTKESPSTLAWVAIALLVVAALVPVGRRRA